MQQADRPEDIDVLLYCSLMGLDAVVYCDCYEAGRLRSDPDPAWNVYVDVTGRLESRSKDLEVLIAFDAWHEHACEHEGGLLVHEYLGNTARIGRIRSELAPDAAKFPVLLTKVIYSSSHAGDRLERDDIDELLRELDRAEPSFLISQLRRLIDAAQLVGKPICF